MSDYESYEAQMTRIRAILETSDELSYNDRQCLAGILDRPLSKRGVYAWSADFGRMGGLSGTLVTTQEEIAKRHGVRVFFGEVLGKHSDVVYVFDKDDFELVTDDSFLVELVETRLRQLLTGYNPIEWLGTKCAKCDDWGDPEDRPVPAVCYDCFAEIDGNESEDSE